MSLGLCILLTGGPRPGYAWEQTLQAVQQMRFIHVRRFDKAGNLEDERWIEIGPDGYQVRYRQDTADSLLVIEDGETVLAHYRDKNTVVLYDRHDQEYRWIANLRQFLRDFSGPGSMTIEEDAGYRGRPAHHVRWLELNVDCYIDPGTRLPIVIGDDQISYEQPPAGAFDLVIPEGVPVVDKRPGARRSEEPQWLKDEATAVAAQREGLEAFVKGDWATTAEWFARAVELRPGQNWEWYWLGRARYEIGDYPGAIEAFTEVIDIFRGSGSVPHYCHLARGLAYRKLGMEASAKADFGVALGVMIDSLRHIRGAKLFDRADSPRGHFSDEERFGRMIGRLQEVAGRKIGRDEPKEALIAAWETWWRQHAPEYGAGSPR